MKNVNRLLGINELHRRGIRGYGVTVAVLDSGVGLHPDLKQRVIGFQDFVHDKKSPYDDLGHGTHVSGIIAGEGLMSGGQYTGVAPQANLVMLKVLNNNGTGNMQQVIDGIRWIIDYGDRYRIRIVNMSFGTKYSSKEEDEILCHAVNELWNLGYIVVASAGNNGPEQNSISLPGSCEKIITVGADDDSYGGFVNGIYRKNYSGRGNPRGNINKPDVIAPSHRIYSCCHLWKKKYIYVSKTGTSMSAPIVSGVLALLLGKYPTLSNTQCKRILKKTAIDLNMDFTRQGSGRINPEGMFEYVNRAYRTFF